jgi:2-keto-4-pentenoate hydratase/2-oxohepta-3-ene-1,7-dioic acid hydratase in catechol pathway
MINGKLYIHGAISYLMRTVRFRDPYGNTRTGTWVDDEIRFSDRTYNPENVDILPPSDPSKIVCVGINYEDHMEEAGMDPSDMYEKIDNDEMNPVPVIFIKGSNAVAGHRDIIHAPENKNRIDHEMELAVVIGEQCKSVSKENAMDKVAGYSCGNDVSNRDDSLFELSGRWIDFFRGKAFDSAAPVGPVIAPPDAVPKDAKMELRVNGEIRQSTTKDKMMFSVSEIIEQVSKYATLERGDIILTGTPAISDDGNFADAKSLEDGDRVEIEIEGIGTLENEFEIK